MGTRHKCFWIIPPFRCRYTYLLLINWTFYLSRGSVVGARLFTQEFSFYSPLFHQFIWHIICITAMQPSWYSALYLSGVISEAMLWKNMNISYPVRLLFETFRYKIWVIYLTMKTQYNTKLINNLEFRTQTVVLSLMFCKKLIYLPTFAQYSLLIGNTYLCKFSSVENWKY